MKKNKKSSTYENYIKVLKNYSKEENEKIFVAKRLLQIYKKF